MEEHSSDTTADTFGGCASGGCASGGCASISTGCGVWHQHRSPHSDCEVWLQAKLVVVLQPDGHCMYRAVEDQLEVHSNRDANGAHDYTDLRQKTADYMRSHKDELLPFIIQVRT